MPSYSQPPNAFAAEFLERMAELDEPAIADEAETAGTAQVVPTPGGGLLLERVGRLLERRTRKSAGGGRPAASPRPTAGAKPRRRKHRGRRRRPPVPSSPET